MCHINICIYVYIFRFVYIYTRVFVFKHEVIADPLADILKSGPQMSIHSHKSARYGVATVSGIDKIVGLFCKRAL